MEVAVSELVWKLDRLFDLSFRRTKLFLVRELDSFRVWWCEIVASRCNSVAFRVVGMRLLQVVTILWLLSLALYPRSQNW